MKQDIYQRVTDKIVADLEKGELTWLKPWSSGNLEGRITKPLRHNGETYTVSAFEHLLRGNLNRPGSWRWASSVL